MPGKLLIADSSEDFLLIMTELFSPQYQVFTCQDGNTALELLRRESFGLLILDLSLPELDGITLLEQLLLEDIRLPILALTTLLSNYVSQSIQRLNVDYVMRKPCGLHAVSARVSDLFRLPESDARAFLAELLLKLGLDPSDDGYGYLIACILSYVKNPNQALTKELYPSVGKPSRRTGKQVERSMRSTLDKAWPHRNKALWEHYFGDIQERPPCGVLIARLSQEIRQLRE